MKRIGLILIAILLVASPVFSQNVNIPDTAFVYALIEEGVDTNGDIIDMTGIEAFINLESLICPCHPIEQIDLSGNTELTFLHLGNGRRLGGNCSGGLMQLSELNLCNNTKLTKLHLNYMSYEPSILDTTLVWEITPFGNGYETIATWTAKGKPYYNAKGISGYTGKNRLVNMYMLYDNGMISRDLGEFVSEKNLVMERSNAKHTNSYFKWEMNFLSPDKIIAKARSKGKSDTWDDAVDTEFTYNRVK